MDDFHQPPKRRGCCGGCLILCVAMFMLALSALVPLTIMLLDG